MGDSSEVLPVGSLLILLRESHRRHGRPSPWFQVGRLGLRPLRPHVGPCGASAMGGKGSSGRRETGDAGMEGRPGFPARPGDTRAAPMGRLCAALNGNGRRSPGE